MKTLIEKPYILTVFFHPNVSVTALGGAEKRFLENLKFFCNNKNFKVLILESNPSLLNTIKEENCEKILVFSKIYGKGWLTTYLRWILWIFKASIKSFSIFKFKKILAIYVSNNTLPNLLLGCLLSLILNKPLSIVVHHVDLPSLNLGKNSLYNNYRKINYGKLVSLIKTSTFYITIFLLKRKVKKIIAVSRFTAKTLEKNGVFKGKIFVSGNAINLDFIEKVKPYSEKRIFDGVFVGRIAKEKGVFDLVKVWKEIVKVKRNAKLLIIGSGLELKNLKELIKNLKLENNVFVRGSCSDQELYSLLKSSKIFIFPSVFEGWGIAVAEALACGLLVIAYNIPALKENFGSCESVFLVPVGNLEKMIHTTLSLLNLTEEKFKELSEVSKKHVKKFGCHRKIAEKDLEILVLKNKGKKGEN